MEKKKKEPKLFKAWDAQILRDNSQKEINKHLREISKRIKASAKKGNSCIGYKFNTDTILFNVLEKLKELGYKTEVKSGNWIGIDW